MSGGVMGVVLGGTALVCRVAFDFNPVNLENQNAASVVTYRELQGNPETSGNDAEMLATSLDEANSTAKRLAALPEVSRTLTLSNFIPDDQDEKIAAIKSAARDLGPALNPPRHQPAPSDKDVIEAIRKTAGDLTRVAGNVTGPGGEAARHVSDLLMRLAEATAATRSNAEAATVPSLVYDLDQLRNSLDPYPVTVKTLPPYLIRDWVLADGRARVQALPKGSPGDDNVLRQFATSVLATQPSATGPAISLYESG